MNFNICKCPLIYLTLASCSILSSHIRFHICKRASQKLQHILWARCTLETWFTCYQTSHRTIFMESHLVLNVPLRSLYVRKCNICPLPTCLLWQVSSTSLFPIYESCNEILRLWKGNWPSWWEDDPRHKSSGFAFHEGIFQFLFLSFLSSAVFHEYPTQLMNMHWQVCIFRETHTPKNVHLSYFGERWKK